ncbi:MAG: T9SS type A sorting domain-containing protein, partial [Bacteroidota bacterium]
HPPGEPADLHKVTGNPQLVGPGSGGSGINSVDGYMLQTGSSCINKGTAISGNGGKDYWGNHLYNGLPDIGAHEYPVKSSNGGNWSSPATWNPSGVPTSTSIINLLSGVVMVDVNNAVCNALTVKSGAILRISDSKDLTVYGTHSSAGTESVSIENGAILDNTGTLALKNNLENKNTSPNSLGTGTIEISGGTSQMIGGRNIIRNLYVNNPAGLMLEGDTKVDGTLTLISGNITPGDNNLHLGPLAIIEGAPSEQAMIVVTGTGQLRKEFPSGFTGSFTFPVGDATETTEFSPVTVNYSGGIFEPDNYTGVNLVNSKHPEDPNTGNWLNRYWNITGNETTAFTFNALFHYLPADVHGVESRIGCIKLLPAPEIFYGPADTLLHTLTATGVSQYGTFIGSKTAPEIYTVTGSGYFCAGGTGLTIGLGGSETDASYQLMKNGNPLGDPVPGTGYGLTWSNQFSGIYTIDATNSAGTRAMNDSALVTEKPYPSEAGLISGPATVTQGQTDVHYTVPVIANATGYFWTLPSGAAITSGSNTESILVSFSATATSGIISVYGTNDCGNGTVSPDFSITVNPSIPEQLAVEGTVTGSEAKCYNATQTITIAGNNSTFLVEAGGDATMVAGQKIVFLPETMVQQGGHLWAYITTTSDYCGARGSSMVNSETKELEKISYEPGQDFRVYPNPTEGALTLEFSGIEKAMQTCIEIYRMTGELISKVDVIGVGHHSFSLAGEPAGIYFLRMVDKGKTGTIRIIKY